MDEFYQWLDLNFGNPDYASTACNNIINFKIKNMDFSDYISHIKGWRKDNNLDQKALRHLIRANINNELKDQLLNIVDKPK